MGEIEIKFPLPSFARLYGRSAMIKSETKTVLCIKMKLLLMCLRLPILRSKIHHVNCRGRNN